MAISSLCDDSGEVWDEKAESKGMGYDWSHWLIMAPDKTSGPRYTAMGVTWVAIL